MSSSPDRSDQFTAPTGSREDPKLEEAYERLVSEGKERLGRALLPLCATGFLGGIDVGFGVLIYLVVDARTGNPLLASLAFTIGFVSLLMADSELFTENFLVPVTAVAAKSGTLWQLLRLWTVSLVMNLVGGFVIAAMTVVALPEVRASAVRAGSHYAHLGISWRSFFLAVLAGAVITLLTRMQHATESLGLKVVPAVLMSFVLVAAQLFHSVLDSIMMFAGLLTGDADYGYGDWLGALGWAVFGNLVGGLVLVTAGRLLRVSHRVAEDRDRGGTADRSGGSQQRAGVRREVQDPRGEHRAGRRTEPQGEPVVDGDRRSGVPEVHRDRDVAAAQDEEPVADAARHRVEGRIAQPRE
jgi:formate/nitrite transporter FocA (FNT family)